MNTPSKVPEAMNQTFDSELRSTPAKSLRKKSVGLSCRENHSHALLTQEEYFRQLCDPLISVCFEQH